jgi:hypothetical protein
MVCMFGAIILVAIVAPLALTLRSMLVQRARALWWIIWSILLVAASVAGIYCTTGVEYMADPKLRVVGFPLPIVMFELEKGQWVDFPNDLGALVFLVNVLLFGFVLTLPFSIVVFFRFGIWPRTPERTRGFPVIMK